MPASTEFSAEAGVKLAYSELRRLAAGYLRGNQRGRTLEPAALVHEAYLRLAAWEGVHWKSRSHFVGVAAMVMRQVIWTHARRRNALKRNSGGQRVTFHSDVAGDNGILDALSLEEALQRLEIESKQACRIVVMRVFGGMTVAEIAALLQLSDSTVKRQWVLGKTWLKRHIEGERLP